MLVVSASCACFPRVFVRACVHTPGHDNDSISLFDELTGTLFSGDSLQGRGTPSAGVAFYQSREEYLYTLDTVEKLPVKTILAAHPFDPTDGVIQDVPAFLKLCRDTVYEYDRVLQEARKTCQTMPEFVDYLLEKSGIERHPSIPVLTWHTVAKHLKKRKSENEKQMEVRRGFREA